MSSPIIDVEFRDLIPPSTDDERTLLKERLVAEGCRDALVVWAETNILLDGHNRLAICEETGVGYRVAPKSLPSRAAAREWILRNQLARRNLSAIQRAELALLLKPSLEVAASKGKLGIGRVNAELGKVAGISHETLRKVERIQKEAKPEVLEQVRAGKLSISAGNAIAIEEKRQREHHVEPSANKGALDKVGRELPDDLLPIFERGQQLADLMQAISRLKSAFTTLADDPICRFINLNQVKIDLGNAYRAIRFGMPYAVCPYHAHDALAMKGCKACDGEGWVGKLHFDTSPKGMEDAQAAE